MKTLRFFLIFCLLKSLLLSLKFLLKTPFFITKGLIVSKIHSKILQIGDIFTEIIRCSVPQNLAFIPLIFVKISLRMSNGIMAENLKTKISQFWPESPGFLIEKNNGYRFRAFRGSQVCNSSFICSSSWHVYVLFVNVLSFFAAVWLSYHFKFHFLVKHIRKCITPLKTV